MTQKQLTDAVARGEFLAVGEYRLSEVAPIAWRDKVSGQPKTAVVLRHTVEFGAKSCAVNERVPDGVKAEDVKVVWKKGQRVVMHLEEYTSSKGLVSCRGRLEELNASL
jgi:hypothetical protein